MKSWRLSLLAAFALLAACGQPAQQQQAADPPAAEIPAEEPPVETSAPGDLPEVDPVLLAAPNNAFTPIEPSEVGVFGAPTVMEAVQPLIGMEAQEGDARVHLTLREIEGNTIVDVVRTGIPDDSVTAGHVRLEFRREPDGWYPTNAYRRVMCGRGPAANEWTTELCP